ncbi:MAG: disulfide bond formation protein B [Sphingobium sp.]|nr:disulfide bond formation protein B [Sphingobium sp.]
MANSLSVPRLIALLVPAGLLGGALISQYAGGLAPCEMCMWQRWPHLIAIGFALAAYGLRQRPPLSATFIGLAALGIAISGVIGGFHAGVEYGWWEGLTACSTSMAGGSTQDVLDAIMAAPLTRCDVAPWSLFGISLAGYNALFSLVSAAIILILLLRWKKDRP